MPPPSCRVVFVFFPPPPLLHILCFGGRTPHVFPPRVFPQGALSCVFFPPPRFGGYSPPFPRGGGAFFPTPPVLVPPRVCSPTQRGVGTSPLFSPAGPFPVLLGGGPPLVTPRFFPPWGTTPGDQVSPGPSFFYPRPKQEFPKGGAKLRATTRKDKVLVFLL